MNALLNLIKIGVDKKRALLLSHLLMTTAYTVRPDVL